jgi:DNA-binding SARP family transcriptional activator/tetratricopeptide (TPR) repeat protein
MRFRILGSLEAEAGDGLLSAGPPGQQRVLAVLLLNANQAVPVTRLVDALWDARPPATAAKQARNTVSRLRKLLAPGGPAVRIETAGTGYRLCLPAAALDASLFEAQVRAADAAMAGQRDHEALLLLREALALWRGPALDGLTGQVIEAAAAAWDERRCAVMEKYYDCMLALGQHRGAVVDLTGQVAEHPLREKPAEKLMLALYRCGRRADALSVYARTRAQLAEELGLDPGPGLQRLHQQILCDDPALAPAPAPAGPAGNGHGGAVSPVPPPAAPVLAGPAFAVPHQLPPAARYFAGRAADLAALDELLAQLPRLGQPAGHPVRDRGTVVISAIDGTAGIGKTALAIRWAHQVAGQFPDGTLYVNLRGFDPAGPPVAADVVLRGFLGAVGIPPSHIPADEAAQAALYRSVLAGKRMLIVLDNARDCAQVRPLLPGSAGCLVVVTSRSQLTSLVVSEGAQPLTVGLMGTADARDLLTRRIGPARVASEPAAVAELIELCARLPLAMSIMAAQAAARPTRSLAELVAGLRQRPGRLTALSTGDPSTNVRDVFSWSYRQLSGPAAGMFRLLGVHCGPDISAAAAASLAGLDADQAAAALTELTRAHLLTEQVPGRYECHDLLRGYAAEQARDIDGDGGCAAAVRRVLDHYVHTADAAACWLSPTRPSLAPASPGPQVRPEPIGDDGQALAWFTAECDVLRAALRQADAGFEAHAWRLGCSLVPYFCLCVSWPEWAATSRLALAAAQRAGDLTGQASAHLSLGLATQRLGSPEPAGQHLRQAIDMFLRAGHQVGAARAEFDLAFTLVEQGRPDEALAHVRRAEGLYRAAGHPAGQATAVGAAGWCLVRAGRPAEALAACREGLALLSGLSYRLPEAYVWHATADAHHQLGQHHDAMACYGRALDLYGQVGERYFCGRALACLGDTQQAAGDHDAARGSWQQALSVFQELRHPDAREVEGKLTGPRPVMSSAVTARTGP